MTTRLIALGDSIFAGLASDGHGGHVTANPTIPQMVASTLGWDCDNQSIGGTKFTDSDGKGTNFTDQVRKFNFADYGRVLIGWEAKALDLFVRTTGSYYQRIANIVNSRFLP